MSKNKKLSNTTFYSRIKDIFKTQKGLQLRFIQGNGSPCDLGIMLYTYSDNETALLVDIVEQGFPQFDELLKSQGLTCKGFICGKPNRLSLGVI